MAKRSGLGKGLESLMGDADVEVGAMRTESVLPLSQIKTNKNQPRKAVTVNPWIRVRTRPAASVGVSCDSCPVEFRMTSSMRRCQSSRMPFLLECSSACGATCIVVEAYNVGMSHKIL